MERIAIIIGLFELVFLPAALFAHPDPGRIVSALSSSQPLSDKSYLLLIAATQVIMAAVLVLSAATIGKIRSDAPLDSIQQIADALTPMMGSLQRRPLTL